MPVSGYTYAQTPVVHSESTTVKALPRTGNEVSIGFAGNTAYFSRAPEEDLEGQDPMFLVRVMSPVGAEFAVPAHWHRKTSEYFRVFAGEAQVTIDGVTRTVTPADGEVLIPANSIHGLLCPKDIHVEVGERADPDPIRKMRFLHRMLGKGGQKEELGLMQAMRMFHEDGDSFPSTGLKTMDILMVNVLGGFFGSFLGFGKMPDWETARTD